MYNGWPATYGNIAYGQTFQRTVALELANHIRDNDNPFAVVLGAAGVGKTTAARQLLLHLEESGIHGWEHHSDHPLTAKDWLSVARALREAGQKGVLFIDEAHTQLYAINDLVDGLVAEEDYPLRLVLVSTRHQWQPRIKNPSLFRLGRMVRLSRLDSAEIERLIDLVQRVPELEALVSHTFSGFSRHEARRRLVERCESDMFVCLKNIFASESFDDIVLREYATLDEASQDVYRHVAALESAGIRVHRQLIIRLLGIPSTDIGGLLSRLVDIIHEYEISSREGIYGWRGRHPVIAGIIAEYKYGDPGRRRQLFERYVRNISPTYEIEIRSMREFCSASSGLYAIPGKDEQNILLRMIISSLPGERVPRHRLIRNLIAMGEHEKAETEIRIFESDFRADGPVTRYKVDLLRHRAKATPGILPEDRLVILERAEALAAKGVTQFPWNKGLLKAYGDVGMEVFKESGSYDVIDRAMAAMKLAEENLGDPEVARLRGQYRNRVDGVAAEASEIDDEDD